MLSASEGSLVHGNFSISITIKEMDKQTVMPGWGRNRQI